MPVAAVMVILYVLAAAFLCVVDFVVVPCDEPPDDVDELCVVLGLWVVVDGVGSGAFGVPPDPAPRNTSDAIATIAASAIRTMLVSRRWRDGVRRDGG